MRRKQVVLPDPEGPSIAKNSPSAMSRVTPSTARTEPKWRQTFMNLTAGDMGLRHRGGGPVLEIRAADFLLDALLAEDGDVVLCPLRVGYAGARLFAFGRWRTPEPDLPKIVEPVGGAARIGQERIALAGRRHRRHRAEPRGEVTL